MRPTTSALFKTIAGCSAVLSLALTVGCNAKDPGTASGGSGGSGGSAPATTFQTTECGTCVQTNCKDPISACESDPGCSTYLSCLLLCKTDDHGNADADCDAACVPAGSSTETKKQIAGVTGCRTDGPGLQCQTCNIQFKDRQSPAPSQHCDFTVPPFYQSQCDMCYAANCCGTWKSCFDGNNPDCDALATCLGTCTGHPSEACMKACYDAHPASVETLLTEQSCSLSYCSADQPKCDASTRDACSTCAYVTCGDSFINFTSTEEGFLTFACQEDCGAANQGPDCTEACVNAHPTAADANYAWAECLEYQCATSC